MTVSWLSFDFRYAAMTANLRVLIVDDEPLARRNLERALLDRSDWEVAGSFQTAEEARAWLPCDGLVHLVLLDIRMPGEGGLSLARYLAETDAAPVVAFVTAYDEYAIDAFELFAIDYLQKPFSDRRLSALLDRAKAMIELRQGADPSQLKALAGDLKARQKGKSAPPLESFVVRSIGAVEKIAITDVNAIRGAGNYVELHLPHRTVLHRASMSAIAERLPPEEFLQVHRTALVRREQIQSLKTDGGERYRVELKCGLTLPVSSRHLASVRAQILG